MAQHGIDGDALGRVVREQLVEDVHALGARVRDQLRDARGLLFREVEVEVRGADGVFVPLESERIFCLVSNNFLRRGGDGYDVLRDSAIDAYDFGPVLADSVVAYLAAHSPVAPQREGRISRLDE